MIAERVLRSACQALCLVAERVLRAREIAERSRVLSAAKLRAKGLDKALSDSLSERDTLATKVRSPGQACMHAPAPAARLLLLCVCVCVCVCVRARPALP
jgi:hypothetical protein